jgi:hypothetical protein
MKQIKPIFFILILAALVSGSCKKSGSTPQTAVSLTFKFNGTAKTATLVVTDLIKSQNSIQVAGTINSVEAVSLVVQAVKVGTYDVVKDNALLSYSSQLDFNHTYIGTSGSMTITALTATTIDGTFQFTGQDGNGDTGTITEGKFHSTIITQ